MRGKTHYLLIIFLLFTALVSNAQNNFEYDYARFYNPNDSTGYVELYYSFYKPALKSVVVEGQNVKHGKLGVKITDKTSQDIAFQNEWNLTLTDADQNEDLLVGVLDFPLEPSIYEFVLTAADINNGEFEESYVFDIDLPILATETPTVSDISLATQIIPQSSNTESLFYKNSMEVVPNPSLIYGDSNPVLFFYSEIYGLSGEGSGYVVEQKLFNSNNEMVHKKSRSVSGENSSIVELGAIRGNDLNSGIYNLVVSVKNKALQVTSSSAKRVYVYNRDKVDQSTNFTEAASTPLESELMVMSEDELNDLWIKAQYIASELEKKNWTKLTDVDGKRKYLNFFWEKRDPEPSTPLNEAKKGYYERVNHASKTYSNVSDKLGWKTDRGRVYIQYGEPDEIERFQNEYYSDPYEIWHYRSIEGGVLFLFADEQGLNIYRLIHSTKKGEISNYREYLRYAQ